MSYPKLPYSIRIKTLVAIIWMIWEDTAWDTPSPVTYESDFEPAIDELKDFFKQNPVGFQGYLIDDVDLASPIDIADILGKHKGGVVRDFEVIGWIPEEPVSPPDEDVVDDDDFDENGDEPPVAPILEFIPQNTKIRLPFILEDTGETVFIETDAQEALDESKREVAILESILSRMES